MPDVRGFIAAASGICNDCLYQKNLSIAEPQITEAPGCVRLCYSLSSVLGALQLMS